MHVGDQSNIINQIDLIIIYRKLQPALQLQNPNMLPKYTQKERRKKKKILVYKIRLNKFQNMQFIYYILPDSNYVILDIYKIRSRKFSNIQ